MTDTKQLKTAQFELFDDALTTGATDSKGECIEMVIALSSFNGHELDIDANI
jgi:hypothetical protein